MASQKPISASYKPFLMILIFSRDTIANVCIVHMRMKAQHVLVTQIVGVVQDDVSEETLEPYYITDAIYGIIADALLPYSAGYQFEEN
jgi:uncharacterized membrane protein